MAGLKRKGQKRSIAERFAAAEQVAVKQRGLLTHAQLEAKALNRMAVSRLVAAEKLVPLLPRVWRLAGVEPSEAQTNLAALWAYEGAALSHRSAGRLYGLDGCEGSEVEITLPEHLRQQQGVRIHQAVLAEEEISRAGGARVTSIHRTLRDLALVLDEERLAFAVESAWLKRLIDPAKILAGGGH